MTLLESGANVNNIPGVCIFTKNPFPLSDSGADVNDPDVRIYDKFCHLEGKKAQADVGFQSFEQVVAQLMPAFTGLYYVSGAYKGFR